MQSDLTPREHRDLHEAQDRAFEGEHWFAWGMGAVALVLGILGLLRAYGAYGPANTTPLGQVTSISPGGLPDTLWDGGVLMLAALAAALLALAFHRNDHHRMRDPHHLPDREERLWDAEHMAAYALAALTIAMGVIGLLTAYNKVGGHHWQPDGIPWLLAAVGTGLLSSTLHGVRHHQLAVEEDRLVRIVEERVTMTGATPASSFVQQPADRTRR